MPSTTKKLEDNGVFEVVSDGRAKRIHYVSHHHVIKLGSATTPVRPVCDASCKIGKVPSFNECTQKGRNYIQLISDVILLFKKNHIGFVSDIKKGFLMKEVKEKDRDDMRFLCGGRIKEK